MEAESCSVIWWLINSQGSGSVTKLSDTLRPLWSLPSVHQAHTYTSLHDIFTSRIPAASRPRCLGLRTSLKVRSIMPGVCCARPLSAGSYSLCVGWRGRQWEATGQCRAQILTSQGTHKSLVCSHHSEALFLSQQPSKSPTTSINIFSVPFRTNDFWLLQVFSATKIPESKTSKA